MKCPLCTRERLLFWCLVGGVSHLVCCIECAVRFGYRVIEEVVYERKGMEVRGTSKGRESVQDMREYKEPNGSSQASSGKRG